MEAPWRTLSRHLDDDGFKRLWQDIMYGYRTVKKGGFEKSNLISRFKNVTKHAAELQAAIRDANLDHLIFEFLSNETMDRNGSIRHQPEQKSWLEMDPWSRNEFAQSLLLEWPSILEVIKGLEAKANAAAEAVKNDSNMYERNQGDARVFSRYLKQQLNATTGKNLNAAIAAITNVLFGTTLSDRQVYSSRSTK